MVEVVICMAFSPCHNRPRPPVHASKATSNDPGRVPVLHLFGLHIGAVDMENFAKKEVDDIRLKGLADETITELI